MLPTPFHEALLRAIEQIDAHGADYDAARLQVLRELATAGLTTTPEDEREISARLALNVLLRNSLQIYKASCSSDVLREYPAQELILSPQAKFNEDVDWKERWLSQGGKLVGGRMIALKSDPIWHLISDFGYPFPPFAPGSLMDLRPVARDEAIQLGLMDQETVVQLWAIGRPTKLI